MTRNEHAAACAQKPGGVTEENLAFISSVRYVTENYPPVCYMTCTGDFLKGQAPLLAEKLLLRYEAAENKLLNFRATYCIFRAKRIRCGYQHERR